MRPASQNTKPLNFRLGSTPPPYPLKCSAFHMTTQAKFGQSCLSPACLRISFRASATPCSIQGSERQMVWARKSRDPSMSPQSLMHRRIVLESCSWSRVSKTLRKRRRPRNAVPCRSPCRTAIKCQRAQVVARLKRITHLDRRAVGAHQIEHGLDHHLSEWFQTPPRIWPQSVRICTKPPPSPIRSTWRRT